MKNLLFLAALLCSGLLTAQVTQGRATFDKMTLEALQMTIDADYKEVADAWEDFFDDRYEIDFDKKDKDRDNITTYAEDAIVPLVSPSSANYYANFSGNDEVTRVSFAVSFGENDVMTKRTHTKSYDAARAIMTEFRTKFYTDYFDKRLEDARDDLADIRDDSQDASEDAKKARRKIEKYEDKINKYQRKIEDLKEEVGDELETAEEKAVRARQLEDRVRELERLRARYIQ